MYDKATLALIPSGYKSGTLYSVVPNTADGDFTVTGDPEGEATRVNKDGLIESVAANVPRLDYPLLDGVVQDCPTLLLEPTRTQLAHYTNAISSANGYGLTNGTLTTDSHTAPDGSDDASTFQATSANGQFQKVKTGSSGVEYTVSVYVKRKTGTGTVYLRAVENTNTAVTVTDEWTRVSLTVTSTSTNIRYGMALATSGDEIYVWGFQVEAGSFATSLIPNPSGTDLTRAVDSCFINSGLQDILNTSEGTLFLDLETPRIATSSAFSRIVLSDQASSTDRLIFDDFAGNWRALLISSAGIIAKTILSVTANQRLKVAIAYSSTGLTISYNGTSAVTTSGSYTPSTTLESFKFSNKDGGFKFEGKVYQAMYFNTALTNTELQALTS